MLTIDCKDIFFTGQPKQSKSRSLSFVKFDVFEGNALPDLHREPFGFTAIYPSHDSIEESLILNTQRMAVG